MRRVELACDRLVGSIRTGGTPAARALAGAGLRAFSSLAFLALVLSSSAGSQASGDWIARRRSAVDEALRVSVLGERERGSLAACGLP